MTREINKYLDTKIDYKLVKNDNASMLMHLLLFVVILVCRSGGLPKETAGGLYTQLLKGILKKSKKVVK